MCGLAVKFSIFLLDKYPKSILSITLRPKERKRASSSVETISESHILNSDISNPSCNLPVQHNNFLECRLYLGQQPSLRFSVGVLHLLTLPLHDWNCNLVSVPTPMALETTIANNVVETTVSGAHDGELMVSFSTQPKLQHPCTCRKQATQFCLLCEDVQTKT